MATSIFHCFLATVFLVSFTFGLLSKSDAQVGVSYGQIADNLPPADEVIPLLKQYNIKRVRIYDPNQAALKALGGSDIEVVVGVRNGDIQNIAASQQTADQWVQTNVKAYPAVKFRYIIVGNEISPTNSAAAIAPYVLPALEHINAAASSLGIKTTTAFEPSLLGSSYPPSNGSFKNEVASYVGPIIEFLIQTEGPVCFNIYPYFAYADNTGDIRLDFALGTAAGAVVQDGSHNYSRLFDAQVDAVYSALEKAGGGALTLVVTETGWPTDAGVSTTIDNAKLYNNNIIKNATRGSPKKNGQAIETYIFALFDENQKSPELEKHWGLFSPIKQPKYNFSFINDFL